MPCCPRCSHCPGWVRARTLTRSPGAGSGGRGGLLCLVYAVPVTRGTLSSPLPSPFPFPTEGTQLTGPSLAPQSSHWLSRSLSPAGDPAAEEWSQWSVCSLTCGQGSQVRTRSCVSSPYGTLCSGLLRETRTCNNTATCPGTGGRGGTWGASLPTGGCPPLAELWVGAQRSEQVGGWGEQGPALLGGSLGMEEGDVSVTEAGVAQPMLGRSESHWHPRIVLPSQLVPALGKLWWAASRERRWEWVPQCPTTSAAARGFASGAAQPVAPLHPPAWQT